VSTISSVLSTSPTWSWPPSGPPGRAAARYGGLLTAVGWVAWVVTLPASADLLRRRKMALHTAR
jgi:hypothetical protein